MVVFVSVPRLTYFVAVPDRRESTEVRANVCRARTGNGDDDAAGRRVCKGYCDGKVFLFLYFRDVRK